MHQILKQTILIRYKVVSLYSRSWKKLIEERTSQLVLELFSFRTKSEHLAPKSSLQVDQETHEENRGLTLFIFPYIHNSCLSKFKIDFLKLCLFCSQKSLHESCLSSSPLGPFPLQLHHICSMACTFRTVVWLKYYYFKQVP